MEVTQFTYFQQAGGIECKPVLGEITYGLERLCMYLQNVDDVFDIVWTHGPDGTPVTYRDVYHQNEVEQSAYNFEHADVAELFHRFDACEAEAFKLIELGLPLPAYDQVCKASPQLQPAGRAPRDRRDRAPALHPARAQAGAGGGRSLPCSASSTRLPGGQGRGQAQGARAGCHHAGGGGMSLQPLLIELGTEELPVKALPGLAQALFDGVIAALDKRGVAVERGDAKPLYSPRRLAVLLPGVASEQPQQRSEVLGPYLNIALDAHGAPTRALQGFAAKAGVAWDALEKTTRREGRALRASRGNRRAHAPPTCCRRCSTRRWPACRSPSRCAGATTPTRFARPLHWLVALFGDDVVELQALGIRAGRNSRGHRFHHDKPVWIGSPAEYVDALRAAHVLVDPDERRARIVAEVETAAKAAGGQRAHRRRQPGAGQLPQRMAGGGGLLVRARVPGGAAGSAGRDDGNQPEVLPGAGRRRQADRALHRHRQHRIEG